MPAVSATILPHAESDVSWGDHSAGTGHERFGKPAEACGELGVQSVIAKTNERPVGYQRQGRARATAPKVIMHQEPMSGPHYEAQNLIVLGRVTAALM